MKFNLFYLFSLIAFCSIKPTQNKHTMLFAHGLADTHLQANLWKPSKEKKPYIFDGTICCKDFLDATTHFWRVNFPWTSLGQDNEIEVVRQAYLELKTSNPEQRFILGGLSRGAATVLNFLATDKPQQIDAVVLESPFSSMRDVAQNIVESCFLNNIPYAKEISPYLVGLIFWQYSDAGIHPINVIHEIDQNIPIMIISKKDDYLVPTCITQRIVDALKANGHTKIHHLVLNNGKHGKYILGDEGERMQNVVHAFYKQYDLPHNQLYALLGKEDFLKTF
jgi:pimeloyl-ACP methyl ester carboxylesterase